MNKNNPGQEKRTQKHPEVGENTTQYGEFVSTYFAWIPLPEQKEKAEKMAKITKGKKYNGNEISLKEE